jgi:hypothetical protein
MWQVFRERDLFQSTASLDRSKQSPNYAISPSQLIFMNSLRGQDTLCKAKRVLLFETCLVCPRDS